MKNRKNILTYIVAAVATLVISADSSPGAARSRLRETTPAVLTHGGSVSCEGQILNPPAYTVGGTWVLDLERMTQPQVPPPASLTMVVFRDGSKYFVLPHIELTPGFTPKRHLHLHVGNSGGGDARYEHDSRDVRVARRLRRQLHPAQLRVADLLRNSEQLGT